MCQDPFIDQCKAVAPWNLAINVTPQPMHESMKIPLAQQRHPYLNLRASRSDSSRQRISSSRTTEHFISLCPSKISHSLVGAKPKDLFACDGEIVPGPLTLRIMLRVVSSINSTLTWVTPPREPKPFISAALRSHLFLSQKHTGTAQDTGDLHKLDGNLWCIHICDLILSVSYSNPRGLGVVHV